MAISGPVAVSFRIDKVTPAAAVRTLGLGAPLQVTSDSPMTPLLTIPLTGDAVPVRLSGFAAE